MGTAFVLTETPSPVDASFIGGARYMSWPVGSLRSFLDKRPELRLALQRLVNLDLARKLEGALTR